MSVSVMEPTYLGQCQREKKPILVIFPGRKFMRFLIGEQAWQVAIPDQLLKTWRDKGLERAIVPLKRAPEDEVTQWHIDVEQRWLEMRSRREEAVRAAKEIVQLRLENDLLRREIRQRNSRAASSKAHQFWQRKFIQFAKEFLSDYQTRLNPEVRVETAQIRELIATLSVRSVFNL